MYSVCVRQCSPWMKYVKNVFKKKIIKKMVQSM